MFTGIIEGLGKVVNFIQNGSEIILDVCPPWSLNELILGESISINGVCLTVSKILDKSFFVDVSFETLKCTTLGYLKCRDAVNLERSLSIGGRLGGHIVTGHVDCVGKVINLIRLGSSLYIKIGIIYKYLCFIIEKGSVALDGISLTINEVGSDYFTLNIIPHTLASTTLQFIDEGSLVNIELDIIGKYIAKLVNYNNLLSDFSSKLTQDYLTKMGF